MRVPATGTAKGAPPLEEILWRAMDRFPEGPALLDAEEFAEHIFHAFETELPEEIFAERIFVGADRMHRRSASLAQAVVSSARQRLHVYQFELDRLEYVIVEDGDQVVVVSHSGQFRLDNDAGLARTLEAAVVKRPGPSAGEPRAWLVRSSGEVVAVEVAMVARTLERLSLRQASMPAVRAPGRRLARFSPVRKALDEAQELFALGQNLDLLAAVTDRWMAADRPGFRESAGVGRASPFFPALEPEAPGRTYAVETAETLVLVSAAPRATAGERALAEGEMLAAVRGGDAPIQALASPRAAEPFLAAAPPQADSFWLQPEKLFLPEAAGEGRTLVVRPLLLGQITGDPWADWELASGGATAGPGKTFAARPRPGGVFAARGTGRTIAAPPDSRAFAAPLSLFDSSPRPVDASALAFRAPDGTLVAHPKRLPIALPPSFGRDPVVGLRAAAAIAPRSGALPVSALRALHLSLERTAAAGGYRLPVGRLGSSPYAIPVGRALQLPSGDMRRSTVRLAAPPSLRDHTARLLLSMPFPATGRLHVGEDLSHALHAYLATPALPVVPSELSAAAPGPAVVTGASRELAVRSARKAVAALEGPEVEPLLAASPSLSGLPALLQRALVATGSWTPGPGAPLPLAIREVAERSPYEAPSAQRPARPLGLGEEEIVIPLPLWARMGQPTLSEPAAVFLPEAAEWPSTPGFDRPLVGGGREVEAARPTAAQGATLAEPARPSTSGYSLPEVAESAAVVEAPPAPAAIVPQEVRAAAGPAQVSSGRRSASIPELHRGETFPRPVRVDADTRLAAPAAPAARAVAAPRADVPFRPAPRQEIVAAGDFAAPPAASSIASTPFGSRRAGATSSSLPQAVPPAYRSPRSLRFRYPGAPLWWSPGSAAAWRADHAGSPAPVLSLRAGLAAANTAAAIWRMILIAGTEPDERESGPALAVPQFAPAGLGSLPAVRPAPGSAGPQALPSAPANAAAPAFIAVSSAGAAGAVPAGSSVRARAQTIEMSIVAAIPPAPPPLSAMSSLAPVGPSAPQARGRGTERGQQPREAEDLIAHSKIEGSVDAIAQRIYHRIRRRLQSDRERFGG